MTADPLVPLTLVIACVAAACAGFARGRSVRHSLGLGVAVAFACGLVLPTVLMAAVLALLGGTDDPVRFLTTTVGIGGSLAVVTAPLSLAIGAVSGLVGRAVAAWLDRRLGRRWRSSMTVLRGFALIAISAISFGVAGGLIGYGLGRFVPAYYRAVEPRGHDADFDPLQVGLGLGVTQGFIAGLVAGAVVVLAVALAGRPPKRGEPLDLA